MRRLLAEIVSKTNQADDEIHEDQLLNLLVNSLDEEVALTLAENAEIDATISYRRAYTKSTTGINCAAPLDSIYKPH